MNSRHLLLLTCIGTIALIGMISFTLAWVQDTETMKVDTTTATQGFTLMEVDGTEYTPVSGGRDIKLYNGSEDPLKDRSLSLDGDYVLWSNFGYIGTVYLKDGDGNTLATFTFPEGDDYLTSSQEHIDTGGHETVHLEKLAV